MEIPTSYGSLDAGKLMRIWGRVTRSEHISDADPIGRLATVGSRVYTNDDAASYKCVVNFSELVKLSMTTGRITRSFSLLLMKSFRGWWLLLLTDWLIQLVLFR